MSAPAPSARPNRDVFLVEFCHNGTDIDPQYALAAANLGRRVVTTARNNLLKRGQNGITVKSAVHSNQPTNKSPYVMVRCGVPGMAPLVVSQWDTSPIFRDSADRLQRPEPPRLAKLCLKAACVAVNDVDLSVTTASGWASIASGPQSLWIPSEVHRLGAKLPAVRQVLPTSAAEFAAEIVAVSNTIFDVVSGSSKIPSISCELVTVPADYLAQVVPGQAQA